MIADFSDSVLTPATILWVITALIAATLLFGSINRRRTKLTETLRDYVDQNAIEKRSQSRGSEKKQNGSDA